MSQKPSTWTSHVLTFPRLTFAASVNDIMAGQTAHWPFYGAKISAVLGFFRAFVFGDVGISGVGCCGL